MDNPDKRPENPALLEDERLAAPQLQPDLENVVSPGGRASDTTNVHDAGSDANDTSDGLSEQEEAARHAAEDIQTGQSPAGSPDSEPVFDRGSLPPQI